MPGAPVNIVPIILIALFGWRMYSRVRRHIGRQPLNPQRMIWRIGIYAALTLFIGVSSLALTSHYTVLAGMMGGVALGAVLGLFGVHLTRFESTPEGRFYTPNPYMGVGLAVLLVGRLAYRLILFSGAGAQSQPQPQLMQSPLTLFIFGMLAGYYMAYFTGVLVRSRAKQPPVL